VLFAGAVERGFGQIIEQGVGLAIEHAVSLLDSGLADGLCQVTLAGAGWAEKQGIFVARDEGASSQIEDSHAQPKKSAVPIFRRMLASHERSLAAAQGHREPAGQIAAREMEIVRIKGALQRAEELSDDVAAAIERAL
jgi:hypothetical protein